MYILVHASATILYDLYSDLMIVHKKMTKICSKTIIKTQLCWTEHSAIYWPKFLVASLQQFMRMPVK